MKTKLHIVAILAVAALATVLAQGPLTPPPGAPAPVMKTLQQIEPRIDLQNAPAAAVDTGNAAYHFVIQQPGSYYLSANLDVTRTHGILINAERVTLDLNGFVISRASGTAGDGIRIEFTSRLASVRNGSVKGFGNGIHCQVSGGLAAERCGFRDVSVGHCANYGIFTGNGAVFERCRVTDNSGLAGIYTGADASLMHCLADGNTVTDAILAGDGSSLAHCTASGNVCKAGIAAGNGSSLTDCVAHNNTSSEPVSAGITTGEGVTLSGCAALKNLNLSQPANLNRETGTGYRLGAGNTVLNCTAHTNKGAGILAGNGVVITGCSLTRNGFYGIFAEETCVVTNCTVVNTVAGVGIRVGDNSCVKGCTAKGNEADGIQLTSRGEASQNNASNNQGDGIHAFGSLNRIDGNHATMNDNAGIHSEAGDFTVRNTVNGNPGGDLVPAPAAGSSVAPLQQAFSATSPWANLQ